MSTLSGVPATSDRIRRQLARIADDLPGETEALWRRAFWRIAGRYTPYLAVDRDGLRVLVSTSDQVLGRRLFVYHRAPELDIQIAFDALRAIPTVAERLAGRGIVEIGANIGSHTVEMLTRFGAERVVAIEPSPENCMLLRHNVVGNGLADRVTVLPIALSDQIGSVSLELSATNPGDHRVRVKDGPDRAGDRLSGSDDGRLTIEVRAATFDSLVETGEVDLAGTGAIWMDAQGHEGHILAGARRLLESEIPIVTEYWPYGLRRAGGLDRLHELIASHYHYVVLLAPEGAANRVIASAKLPELEQVYGWSDEAGGADLVLSHQIQPR
ncbi:MAG: FkbM family methyltransferase [Solirubrobacteraceae bacterium]